ncbi:uncharacterized protein LOC110911484 [Helianthus annuus]|uniref:uncharacterized protein LOC110911484 n=1 Tax=Helianthus annuus TaxID=4232 RepID=UPI000B8FE705|nr:uncharacterized protein LOC110911484 [Helianthus annuus]
MVTLDSMQRANSTLEDFCKSYFMFHEMDANCAESIFKYLPLLSFTESYIYQLDSRNEKLMQSPSGGTSDFLVRKLFVLLESCGLLTDRIRNELKSGKEYFALERKLCCALTSKQEIRLEDVMKANYLRSTDYRVLNLLLYQLNGKEVNETHMEFLSASEFLGEISDDLFDYEARLITEAQEKYKHLLSILDPQLALKYQNGREEAARQSGKELASRLGKWSMPPAIEDEDLYRYEISNTRFISK